MKQSQKSRRDWEGVDGIHWDVNPVPCWEWARATPSCQGSATDGDKEGATREGPHLPCPAGKTSRNSFFFPGIAVRKQQEMEKSQPGAAPGTRLPERGSSFSLALAFPAFSSCSKGWKIPGKFPPEAGIAEFGRAGGLLSACSMSLSPQA